MSPREILQQYWGYSDFRPLQLDIIESVLAGHDTLGLLPTGAGKSITFQVPALMLPGLAIVVTPLISLMKDQVDNLKAKGIKAAALYSGQSRRESNLVCDKARLQAVKLIYVSPERLRNETFRSEVKSWDVSLIVVDEAHCISQWGYDFRPSYLNIASLRKAVPNVPVLALTASATPFVRNDIIQHLDFRDGYKLFTLSFHRTNLSYVIRYDTDKENKLVEALNAVQGCAIVYVRSRVATARYAEILNKAGISATFYHAGLDAALKEERQRLWKENQVRVIVATNAFGMGIDKPDVRLVIHLDVPPSLEEYYQEAGRAGRDGKHAYALLIAANHDKASLTRRLNTAFPPKDFIAQVYEKACVFMDIPVGEGFGHVYEFDTAKFAKTFHFDADQVKSALTILSNAGYFDYNEDPASRSRVHILIRRDEFYKLSLTTDEQAVINTILRLYPGLFADYINVDEKIIAYHAELNHEAVYQAFLSLSRQKILHYIPKRQLPFIYLPTSRELTQHIVLSRSVYDDRKALMAERIRAIRNFVFGADECRDKVLLAYFGEEDADDCGMCDICVGHRKQRSKKEISRSDKKKARKSFEQHVIDCVMRYPGLHITQLKAALPGREDELITTLRKLIDSSAIIRKGNALYFKEHYI
ncbi:MAG: RecQ family ATP-dependent DNA helicase [Muribaculaceae bacterium]|nr:RecQ family ATP-dependent DNA helicase [Muribaculaceae bacterium]